MKLMIITLLIFSIMFLFGGCNKDEEIENLEQEVIESESVDLLADKTAEANETAEEVSEAVDEVAMTPETAPIEESKPVSSMPQHDLTGFTVQIGSGSNYDNATATVEIYEGRGYGAFITEATIDGELIYRVRIGAYEDYNDAVLLGEELKDKYSTNYWIDNN